MQGECFVYHLKKAVMRETYDDEELSTDEWYSQMQGVAKSMVLNALFDLHGFRYHGP